MMLIVLFVQNFHLINAFKNLKSIDEAEDAFKGGKIKMILVIPAQFAQDINSGKKAQLQLMPPAG